MTQAEAWKTLAPCTDFCCTWYPETTTDGTEPKLAHWRMKDEIPQREARWYRQHIAPLPKPATCQWCKWGQLTTETQVHPTEINRASPDGTLPVHRIHTHTFLFFLQNGFHPLNQISPRISHPVLFFLPNYLNLYCQINFSKKDSFDSLALLITNFHQVPIHSFIQHILPTICQVPATNLDAGNAALKMLYKVPAPQD